MKPHVNVASTEQDQAETGFQDPTREQSGNANRCSAFNDLPFLLVGMVDSPLDLFFLNHDQFIHQLLDHLESIAVFHPDSATK